jgi:hypothetical protein
VTNPVNIPAAGIDPRAPRLNQAVVAAVLAVAFAVGAPLAVSFVGALLAVGVLGGPKVAPVFVLWRQVLAPRVKPPTELEDPRGPRFAAGVGAVMLAAATLAFVAGAPVVGWVLALVVMVLAGLAATTGICVGCEIHARLLALRSR